MKTHKIEFYEYPAGPADTMGQSEFVLVRDRLGCTDTRFVGDLVKGDYYCLRIPNPAPPRNADEILAYIAKNQLSINYVLPDESSGMTEPVMIEIVKNGEIQVSVGYDGGKNCIRQAVVPLMDMEEL